MSFRQKARALFLEGRKKPFFSFKGIFFWVRESEQSDASKTLFHFKLHTYNAIYFPQRASSSIKGRRLMAGNNRNSFPASHSFRAWKRVREGEKVQHKIIKS